VDAKTAIQRPVTIPLDDPRAKIQVRNSSTGKNEYVSIGSAAKNMDKNGNMWINGVKYQAGTDAYTTIKDAKTNGSIPVIDNVKKVRAGYYGSDGNLYNVSTDNLNNYTKSNKKTLTATVEGNSGVYEDVKVGVDEKGKPIYEKQLKRSAANVIYVGDINNITDKAFLDYTQGVGQQSYVGGEVKQSVEK
jgi:hypothetical protein